MFSGGESSGEGFNSRNQLNSWLQTQSACLPANQVDWAALAQQWIQMRETTQSSSFHSMPEVPPPPIITNHPLQTQKVACSTYDEQGEADMEVDSEVEKDEENEAHTVPSFGMQKHQQHQNWISQEKQQIQSNEQQEWNAWPPRVVLPPPVLHVPTTESVSIYKQNPQSVPLLKTPNAVPTEQDTAKQAFSTMDAAKRKILPAWIREGLEKMEREKQKQLEREQQSTNQSGSTDNSDLEIKSLVKGSIINTDSDKSGSDDDEPSSEIVHPAKTDKSPKASAAPELNDDEIAPAVSGKTQEELVEELMFVVRRSLTELLLEVTNEEILSIAQETYKKHKTKASSAQVFRKSAISSITGKLGLGAYADSSSAESSQSEGEDDDQRSNHSDDSEVIKASIRARRRNFEAIEEEIDELVAEDAIRTEQRRRERERELERKTEKEKVEKQLKHQISSTTTVGTALSAAGPRGSSPSKSKSYDRDIGETQPDKKYSSNGKRPKERTTRFSDNKSGSSYFVQPTPIVVANATIPLIVPNSSTSKHVPTSASNHIPTSTSNDHVKYEKKSSSSSRRRRDSGSSDESRDSRSSRHKHKRSSKESSKSRSSYKKSSRRDSSDSDDNYRSSRRSRHYSSSSHSRRRNRSRSRSRSTSRSRSRSRSSYSSSKRDRY